jgi:transaldolase
VSRWDTAVRKQVPQELRSRLGIAVATQVYQDYLGLLGSAPMQRLMNLGARPQRLLWGSTSTKDPSDADTLYVEALAAPLTINTMPEKTLKAFASHGDASRMLPRDGGDAARVLQAHAEAGVDIASLAAKLQQDGVEAFAKSWRDLLAGLTAKAPALKESARPRRAGDSNAPAAWPAPMH